MDVIKDSSKLVLNMDRMDIVHRKNGHCPWKEWTLSMVRMDIVHGHHGHCPWVSWTMHMDSMDMDSMDTVQGYKELSMDKCFNTPWTLSMLISMEIHGHSVAGFPLNFEYWQSLKESCPARHQ